MKIFSAEQIKKWDAYTIAHEPISAIDLMERAANACCNWLHQQNLSTCFFKIFCGKGNNGGDGLAIARILHQNGYEVAVYILDSPGKGREEFEINFERLRQLSVDIHFISRPDHFPDVHEKDIILDAIFGTGLSKPVNVLVAALINHLNTFPNRVISIDLPSGLYADKSSADNIIIKANDTLTFESVKLAFMMAENGPFIGRVSILDIGLNKHYGLEEQSNYGYLSIENIQDIIQPRDSFSHKGNYGYACIIAGSQGMMGASILTTKACLRSGPGKVVSIVPSRGYAIIQMSAPEALAIVAGKKFVDELPSLEGYDCVGIGPGIGIHKSHKKLLSRLFTEYKKPIVMDADALNIMADDIHLMERIPPGTILTPHPKEFDTLFGKSGDSFERMYRAIEKSISHSIYIVLKGHHTLITTPEGKAYFNSTGNPGMAKGGSGDVLTGIITGLLAQHYTPMNACLLGVYLHGVAGDIAAEKLSQQAMLAGDLVDFLGQAFRQLWKNGHGSTE